MKKITSMVILLLIVIVAVYDVYAIAKGGTEASISHTLRVWAHKYIALPFSFGFVCGHLFWPISLTEKLKQLGEDLKKD